MDFDNVHAIHRPVMNLKLEIFQLSKLFPHNRALLNPGIRQQSQTVLLNRLVHSLQPWTPDSWKEWCDLLVVDDKVHKAALPMSRKRAQDAAAVQKWRSSKGVAKRSTQTAPQKRTPFTKVTGLRKLVLNAAKLKRQKKAAEEQKKRAR